MAEPVADGQSTTDAKDNAGKQGESVLDVVAPGEEEGSDLAFHTLPDGSVTTVRSTASGMHREKWGSKMQFLMSCIASAVGLGNVWRFPAICAVNGGAAFLIPYIIVLFIIARPLFVLELALGQFSSKGSVRCWDLSPAFTGIGITGMVSSVLLSTFYIMLLAWALIYSVVAFVSICYNPTGYPIWTNDTGFFFGVKVIVAEHFDSVGNTDIQTYKPVCHLVLALIIAWIIIWMTMVFGVEASGKVAYVTAMAPYVVLLILLIAGLMLPGMELGLKFLFYPDVNKLLIPNTWFQAVGQCFFSLGIGFGGCIMFSSFNDFHNDIIRDVYIISVVDSLTSVLASISLMSIIGFQASKQLGEISKKDSKGNLDPAYIELIACAIKEDNGLPEDKKINVSLPDINKYRNDDHLYKIQKCMLQSIIGKQGGAGLAFVHYPNAMNEINATWGHPLGTILGLLFFLMLILLAVGSANGFVGTTVTIIADKHPKWRRSNIVSGVCAFSCFLGLIYTNKIGSEWFDVVDTHGVTAVVYVLAFMEATVICLVYGLKNFCDDIQYMRNGRPPGLYLRVTWVTLPVLMLIIYFYWIATYKRYEHWTNFVLGVAWMITIICLSIIPIYIGIKYFEFRKSPWRRNIPPTPIATFQAIFLPNPKWGPKDPEIRAGWKQFKAERESSYHIFRRIKAFWYTRVLRRPIPIMGATTEMSYATFATGTPQDPNSSGLDSVNTNTPGEVPSLSAAPSGTHED